jgi:hypothetical protein
VASQGLPNSEEEAAPNQRIFTKSRRLTLEPEQANHSLEKPFNDESFIQSLNSREQPAATLFQRSFAEAITGRYLCFR